MKREFKGNLMLFVTAFIWGTAFVAQSEGMDYVGPFTYLFSRSIIGGCVLIPAVIAFRRLNGFNNKSIDERKSITTDSIKAGCICGIVLCISSAFQQFGISMTTVGKAGFITALYIILVPIFGVFIKKKIPKRIWLCVIIALVGFYMLCIKEDFSIGLGDLLVLCCAICFSIHILVIDRFSSDHYDGVLLSCTQFFTVGLLCLIPMLVTEAPTIAQIWSAKGPILYAGVLSSGVAYTLQILGQKYTKPTVATLIMSLESVFAALSGWIILHETMIPKEFVGCVLVFTAVIIAQLPDKEKTI